LRVNTEQADVVTEASEVEEEVRHSVAVAPNLPITVQKTNRVDVTERFGKFDIRQELERKTMFCRLSLVSICVCAQDHLSVLSVVSATLLNVFVE